MQTFLPYPDFKQSACCLDMKRLCKQRVEALQILNTLIDGGRWKNHPAVLMWAGYEEALASYMTACIDEWVRRGYNNNMIRANCGRVKLPSWFGSEAFHASHRSNLLRKNPEWYKQFGWTESNDLNYVWPVRSKEIQQ